MKRSIIALFAFLSACEVMPMDGARDPSATTKPAYTADGTWGWFGPNTIPGAQWFNHVQGEFYNVLDLGGVVFDPEDDTQLATFLTTRGVSAIISSATDTTSVTTPHTRVVVGATTSQASGANAQVSGGSDNTASGSASQVSGGESNTASGIRSQVSGGFGNTASGISSQVSGGNNNTASGNYSHIAGGSGNTASGIASGVAVGSINCENGTPHSLAGGYSVAAVTVNPAVPANQNLSILLKADGGHAHFKGAVKGGGDVDASTGELWSLDGATGLLSLDYDGATAAAFDAGTNWTATNNKPHGKVVVANTSDMALPVGGTFTVTLANSLVAAGFTLSPTVRDSAIVAVVPVGSVSASGSNVFTFMNVGAAALIGDSWSVTFKFVATGTL